GIDLASKSLRLDSRWNGGILRVRLLGLPQLPQHWKIDLIYPNGQIAKFDEITAASRMVGASSSDAITLDVPLIAPGVLTARTTPNGLRLPVIEALFPSHVMSQQMIGKDPRIDLFDSGVDVKERAVGPGFGRLDLLGENSVFVGTCTAFRVANGFWLTA